VAAGAAGGATSRRSAPHSFTALPYQGNGMNGAARKDIKLGMKVSIEQKKDQRTEALTEGTVEDILTNSATHPHGIKVRLSTGEIGRVKIIHD